MSLAIFLSSLLLTATICSAEELSLQKSMDIAIRRNLLLRAVRWQVASGQSLLTAASRPAAAEVTLLPALTAGGTDEELVLTQQLEVNGARRARARLAAAESAMADAEAQVELNDTLADVALAYFEALYRKRLMEATAEALRSAERTVSLVRKQIEAGVRPGIDLVQTEIEAERVRLQSKQREAESLGALIRLNTLLGYPQETPHTLLPVPPSFFSEQSPLDSLPPKAIREQAILNIYEGAVEQLRAEGIPDLGLQLRVERWAGSRTQPGLGVVVRLPFLDYGARHKRLQAQKQLIRSQQLKLQATRQTVASEQASASLLLKAARDRWQALEQEVMPRVERLAQSAQVGLETGAMNILHVLEAQRTVRVLREEVIEAELQMALAWVEWQRIRGYFARTYYPVWKEAHP